MTSLSTPMDKVIVVCNECDHEADDTRLGGTTVNGCCRGCGGSDLKWRTEYGESD